MLELVTEAVMHVHAISATRFVAASFFNRICAMPPLGVLCAGADARACYPLLRFVAAVLFACSIHWVRLLRRRQCHVGVWRLAPNKIL